MKRLKQPKFRNNTNTWDRVFLLSIDEVLRYFGDSGMVARGAVMGHNARTANEPTWPEWGIYSWVIRDQFSEARIATDLQGSASGWWHRSPGFAPWFVAGVDNFGDLIVIGRDANWEIVQISGVRPALWLYL